MSGTRTRHFPELDELVTSIYGQTWDQFYDFNEIYCQQLIDSLMIWRTTTNLVQDTPRANYEGCRRHHVSDGVQVLFISDTSLKDCGIVVNVVDFGADGSASHSSRITVEKISMQSKVRPSDAYESYTPCLRNINTGDDPNNMLFIPYADEPHFLGEEHIGFFENIAWQNIRFSDPDGAVIIFSWRMKDSHTE
jgi:hypothetical protein